MKGLRECPIGHLRRKPAWGRTALEAASPVYLDLQRKSEPVPAWGRLSRSRWAEDQGSGRGHVQKGLIRHAAANATSRPDCKDQSGQTGHLGDTAKGAAPRTGARRIRRAAWAMWASRFTRTARKGVGGPLLLRAGLPVLGAVFASGAMRSFPGFCAILWPFAVQVCGRLGSGKRPKGTGGRSQNLPGVNISDKIRCQGNRGDRA
jgi:hypothetical protein